LLAGCDLFQVGTDVQRLLPRAGTSYFHVVLVVENPALATTFAHRSSMFVPHVLVVLLVALPALATTFAQALHASMLASPGHVGLAAAAGGGQTGEGQQGGVLANHFAGV
jgi:hypothetical protein